MTELIKAMLKAALSPSDGYLQMKRIIDKHFVQTFLLTFLLLLLCFPVMGNSQTRDTTLQGQVVDASGASVPGTRLLIVNLNTLEEQRAVVKPDGKFTFQHMSPGDYVVIAATPSDAPCFRPAVERVRLETDTTRKLRLVLIANPGACAGTQ
jgi:carboxypeptidase family protein